MFTTKPLGLVVASLILAFSAASAAENERIPLSPNHIGEGTLAKAFAERRSSRDFADVELTDQQLSDLLFFTAGINRRAERKTVYPVAKGRQDMLVYVFTRRGVYQYDAGAQALEVIVTGDHRASSGTQDFVARAAVNLVYVQDMKHWDDSPERGKEWGLIHTGAMMQNAYLYAASQDWSAVARGYFVQEDLKKLLKLSDSQFVRLTQSIGPKK